jgi:molybdate transport system substrate-binding protein
MRPARWPLLTLGLVAPAACHAGSGNQRPHLTVFAAASLTGAFNELGDTLRRRHPGLAIDFNFAGSQILALQLTEGASADVFAAADEISMSVVIDSGLVDGDPKPFALNRLVVIVPAANPAKIGRLEDLSRRGVKLVLAGEAVPAGRYARQVVAKLGRIAGFPSNYERQVLSNVVSNEENIKGVVTKVQLGEADAGMVYASDVTPQMSAQVSRIDVPEAANIVATYPIALLRHAGNGPAGRDFLELVFSPGGQRILQSRGLIPLRD